MLLGSMCAGCHAPGAVICEACAGLLRPFPASTPPPGLASCSALLAYDDGARAFVVGLKYRNARQLVGRFAEGLAQLLPHRLDLAAIDLVTWAPTSSTRRHQRGFDHAQLLAVALARRIDRPCRPLLIRSPGPAQTGRAEADRRLGPHFTVRSSSARSPGGGATDRTILLVDDVVTTGATLSAAAGALRHAGAGAVHAAVTARTPRVFEPFSTRAEGF